MTKPIEQTMGVLAKWGDGLSISIVLGTLAGLLPQLSAAAALLWTCIRIYETKTVQDWIKRRNKK